LPVFHPFENFFGRERVRLSPVLAGIDAFDCCDGQRCIFGQVVKAHDSLAVPHRARPDDRQIIRGKILFVSRSLIARKFLDLKLT